MAIAPPGGSEYLAPIGSVEREGSGVCSDRSFPAVGRGKGSPQGEPLYPPGKIDEKAEGCLVASSLPF